MTVVGIFWKCPAQAGICIYFCLVMNIYHDVWCYFSLQQRSNLFLANKLTDLWDYECVCTWINKHTVARAQCRLQIDEGYVPDCYYTAWIILHVPSDTKQSMNLADNEFKCKFIMSGPDWHLVERIRCEMQLCYYFRFLLPSKISYDYYVSNDNVISWLPLSILSWSRVAESHHLLGLFLIRKWTSVENCCDW